jgi:antitoxin HicB
VGQEEGGYTATVPALPGLITQGDTLDEALAMARDAIVLYIEDLVAEGEPIPEDREHPQLRLATVRAAA